LVLDRSGDDKPVLVASGDELINNGNILGGGGIDVRGIFTMSGVELDADLSIKGGSVTISSSVLTAQNLAIDSAATLKISASTNAKFTNVASCSFDSTIEVVVDDVTKLVDGTYTVFSYASAGTAAIHMCKISITDNAGGSIPVTVSGASFRTSQSRFRPLANGPTGTGNWGANSLTYTVTGTIVSAAPRMASFSLLTLAVALAATAALRFF